MAEITPLRAGDPGNLGPYRLLGLLGEGGQGSVYLAEAGPGVLPDRPDGQDRPPSDAPPPGGPPSGPPPPDAPPSDAEDAAGRQVAVKLLHARFSGDPRARSRFAAELRVARRVAPFCTARILDSDVEGDRPYIVSEFIDGPSLSAVLAAEGPRAAAELDRIAIGTMTALAAIHQAGVVHRDLKPGNVLLAPDGPRVIDFGIARALDATGTLSSTAVGTPAYMAPEQISGAVVGPEADVFAWGATMVYAATARTAFGQDSIPAVMHRILNLAPDLGALAEPLRSLVADCLGKDPARRPSSHQVLVRLLSLAGSLPQAAGTGDPRSTGVLDQGAEAAATSTRLRQVAPPPPQPPQPPSGQAPGSPRYAPPPAAGPPFPGAPQPGAGPAPGNGPTTPGGQWSTQPPYGHAAVRPPPPGTWPHAPQAGVQQPGVQQPGVRMTKPPGNGGGRRGLGILAGAGGAALVALIVAGAVVAARVGGDEEPPAPGRDGGEVRAVVRSLGDGGEIDPSHSVLGPRKFVAKQLFTGLVETAPDGTYRNRLATAITPDSTCTQWNISIKGGTGFSNGEPVDAEAFLRGWTRSARVAESSAPYLMSDISGFSEVNTEKTTTLSGVQASGTTLTVELTNPNCEFPARLGDPVFFPVPRSAGEPDDAAYNSAPIGNGPFKVRAYAKDRTLTLVRNDAWAFGKTRLDGVSIRFASDSDAVGQAGIAAGELDWAPLTSDAMQAARGRKNLVTRTSPFIRMLVPLIARGPMQTAEARQAVSYAVDRKALSNELYGGIHRPANHIVPQPVPGFGGGGACPPCEAPDPAKARSLAEQAGLKADAVVNVHVQDTPTYRRLAEAVAHRLRSALGWKVELKFTAAHDYEEQRKAVTAKDASGLLFWAWGPDYPAASTMLRPLLAGDEVATADNGRYNFAGWRNARFDELLAQAVREPDGAKRTGQLQQAEKLALDDLALIPLLYDASAAVANGRFAGLGMDYDGDPTIATAALR